MKKRFRLPAEQIRPIADVFGGCIATGKVAVEGYPVRFMYREAPHNGIDSGWRFTAGFEDDDYMSDPDNLGVYAVNAIANYDPTIIPFLESPIGAVFEKTPESEVFLAVDDWVPPTE